MEIRPAQPTDAPALIALDSAAPSDPSRAADIQEWIATGSCHIAALDGAAAGYCVLTHHFFHQPFIELVMVGRQYRRAGIGSALIRHAVAACRSSRLWTSTNQSNTAMQALLDRLGFSRGGIIEGLDEDDPELIYRIDIDNQTLGPPR